MRGTRTNTRHRSVGRTALLAGIFIAGCNLLPAQSVPDPVDGISAGQGSAPKKPEVFYTAEAGVKLYAEPGFGSEELAELPRHQKLYRSEIDRGFAHVEVDGTGQRGWVENAPLIWKVTTRDAAPATKAPATSAPDPASPQSQATLPTGDASTPTAPTTVPRVAEPDDSHETSPAVFDAF